MQGQDLSRARENAEERMQGQGMQRDRTLAAMALIRKDCRFNYLCLL